MTVVARRNSEYVLFCSCQWVYERKITSPNIYIYMTLLSRADARVLLEIDCILIYELRGIAPMLYLSITCPHRIVSPPNQGPQTIPTSPASIANPVLPQAVSSHPIKDIFPLKLRCGRYSVADSQTRNSTLVLQSNLRSLGLKPNSVRPLDGEKIRAE